MWRDLFLGTADREVMVKKSDVFFCCATLSYFQYRKMKNKINNNIVDA